MKLNSSRVINNRYRQWGGFLLIISAGIGTAMLFLNWFQIAYRIYSSVGHPRQGTYPIKLIDILLHTVSVPTGVTQPYISPLIIGEIGVYIAGILLWGICAIMALRLSAPLKWLYPASGGYMVLVGVLFLSQQMWMSGFALSDPYVGITATIYQWLLLLYCAGIITGSYLISK